MKVLQVINSLSTGGAEKLILDTVPIYQRNGVNTDVLLLDKRKTSFFEELTLKSSGSVTGLSSGSVYNPLLIFKIMPYLKKYDIIHMHLFPTLYWVVISKIFSFSNVNLIYTEHNTNNRRRSSNIWKRIDQFIYTKIAMVVTIAEEVDTNLKRHVKLSSSRVKLIQNGVDVEHYSSAQAYSKASFFSTKDIILIQVSSFRKQKDQKTLIKSLQFLPENVKLILVGEGTLKADCVALVTKLGLEKRVNFLGNRNDVPQLLKTSDIVILSSNHEGLSLSNIEGMSVGKPFIGSNVPGIREIVTGYGLLFEQGDAQGLADLINMLMADSEFYQQTSDACFKRAQDFDINKMVDAYIELYKKVLHE